MNMMRYNPDYAREFIADNGHRFNVHYVPAGSPTYQRGGGRDYLASEPVAEFYDGEHAASDGHPLGQFTGASYYVSTLVASAVADRDNGPRTGPFQLNGGVRAWDIDRGTWSDILAWLCEHGTPSADKAVLLEGWPVRSILHTMRHSARHGEVYGEAEAFTGYTTPAGVECGWYARRGTADCGHPYHNLSADGRAGISTGYILRSAEPVETMCYGCAHRDSLARLDSLAPGVGSVAGYVSGDGRALQTWNGGHLADVVSHRVSRNPLGRVHHWVFRRGTATYYGSNGGPGVGLAVSRHKRRPSYVPAGTSPVTVATDVYGVAL